MYLELAFANISKPLNGHPRLFSLSINLQFFDAVLDGKSYKYSRTSKNFNIKNESLNLLKKYDHKLNEAQLLYQETNDYNFKNIINILKKEKELIENSYNEKIYKVSYEL